MWPLPHAHLKIATLPMPLQRSQTEYFKRQEVEAARLSRPAMSMGQGSHKAHLDSRGEDVEYCLDGESIEEFMAIFVPHITQVN